MNVIRLILPLLICMSSLCSLSAQEHVPFNGIVTDLACQPLKGARIYVTQGYEARSDRQGRFGLTDVQPTDTLHIRYRREVYDVPVEGRKSMRIRLGDRMESQEDQDLVNWGYGFVKRRESLEVSNGLSGESLRRLGYSNVLQALQSRVPGLNITSSARPGEEPTVSMRGINSFYCDQTPLFVVDGVVVPSLEFVNIQDVDHIEILKDASIYGSRGANGAILITTRR